MEQFKNLPAAVKWTLGLMGITTLGAGGYAAMGPGFLVFFGVFVALLVLFLVVYFALKAWRAKKKSAGLGRGLDQDSKSTPTGVTDPAKRARLDDLRRKFEDGVREYKARGKDLYKLPWYVIVGPPASGKTEAIRHSNVGFPPGMQDPLQGVGGTINMNWWFTNNAVILDTAGRLMFEEVKAGETSEWREFLNLLKKNRPNCPINGLLLTISIDSLIKDSADQIEARAGKIAQQLDLIQRILDVRFPVYVIVTKSDLMTGFREFFNGITDPQLQHQIVGWSNPEPLDSPFRPEQIDQHLETVQKRLRRRRLGLLRDPVSDTAGRRTDEVDALFALPNSFTLIAPRLRRYLETIFVAGEWSSKPLFLRGIYFTSSMREGAALDQELAQAIGVPVDELPGGPAWERERAFFLRDLFLEKVFKERGLVTRATNTSKLLRGRQTALYGTGFAALALFIFLFVFGMKSFRSSIGDQNAYWKHAAGSWINPHGYPSWVAIAPPYTGGKYELNPNAINITGLAPVPHTQFHLKLKEFAKNPLRLGVFEPLARVSNLDPRRKKAQRIVFEGSVLRPIIEAARQKLQNDTNSPSPQSVGRQATALSNLVRLEVDILKPNKGELREHQAAQFLDPFLTYLYDAPTNVTAIDTNIAHTMAWVYSEGDGRDTWPPAWLSGGPTLTTNPALEKGLQRFLLNVTRVAEDNRSDVDLFNRWNSNAQAVASSEKRLIDAKELPSPALLSDFSAKVLILKTNIAEAQAAGLVGQPPSLRAAFQKVTTAADLLVGNTLSPIERTLPTNGLRLIVQQKNIKLFDEIAERLKTVRADVKKQATERVIANPADLQQLDEHYLEDSSYELRQEVYRLAYNTTFAKSNLVGVAWQPLLHWQTNAGQLRAKAQAYQGKFAAHTPTVQTWLGRAETSASTDVRHQYVEQVKKQLLQRAGFPLVREANDATMEDLKNTKALLTSVQSDLAAPACTLIQSGASPGWANFAARISILTQIATAVLGTNQVTGQCKLILPKRSDQPEIWRGKWRYISVNASKAFGTGGGKDELLAVVDLEPALTINFFRGDPPKDLYKTFDKWAALKLALLDPSAKRQAPNLWLVNLALKHFQGPELAFAADDHVPLMLEFTYSLPERNEWPTRDELAKLSAH